MSGLIERIERAGGPDREIDRDIMIAAVPCDRAPFRYWAPVNDDTGYGVVDVERVYYAPHCAQAVAVPHFTASIDAAMTLIATDAFKKVAVGSGTKRAFAQLIHHPGGPFGGIKRPSIYVTAATPALALCAAALRARETTPSIKGGDRG